MSADRYVVLGLAHARSRWFTDLGSLATSGAFPIEFVKCISPSELRARIESTRPYSALVIDGSLPLVDRDLLRSVRASGCAPIVVDDGRVERDWATLGADAVLPGAFTAASLIEVLTRVARPLRSAQSDEHLDRRTTASAPLRPPGWLGQLVAVTGSGGAGASVLAAAMAQGAASQRSAGSVLLVDAALHADQAMLHGTPDVLPGLPELVEAHRGAALGAAALRALTFAIEPRGYSLLLGLRRHHEWAALRPRALEAALDAVLDAYGLVIADVDCDVEGQDTCGSIEVEERNLLARTIIERADLVVVVGTPSLKGVHALVRVVADLVRFGRTFDSMALLVNMISRAPHERLRVQQAIRSLLTPLRGQHDELPPITFVPARRRVEQALRDGLLLPAPLPVTVAQAIEKQLATTSTGGGVLPLPERVMPGSLGVLGASTGGAR